jgi:hypothetical protein
MVVRESGSDEQLRPVERRVLRLVGAGLADAEIAQRFRRSPDWVRRVVTWSDVPRHGALDEPKGSLRPLERRVLHWRDQGVDHAAIGDRFHRSGEFIEQVERLARYKLAC